MRSCTRSRGSHKYIRISTQTSKTRIERPPQDSQSDLQAVPVVQPLAPVILCPIIERDRKQHAVGSQAVPSVQPLVYIQHCPIIVMTMCDAVKLAVPMVQPLAFTICDPMKQDCVVVVACQAVPKCAAVSACSMLPNGGSYCNQL